jgi:hypothetical protein
MKGSSMADRRFKLRGSDPRINEPRRRGDTRILDLKSGTWQWKVNATTAFIYNPSDERTEVPLYTILGMTKAEWDKHHDDWSDMESSSAIPITPKDISDYINEKILGHNLIKAA